MDTAGKPPGPSNPGQPSHRIPTEAEATQREVEPFDDPSQEWRRLFSELLGTALLVLVAAGGAMMGQAFPNTISRTSAVVAPGLMVLGVILFMGKVSGAHLNPAVSVAFALRGDFPWRRVPGYVVAQLAGACLAAWFLQATIHVSSSYGSNYPASGFSAGNAFVMETVLTFGLVSVILGTASGAQNVGVLGALGRRQLHRAGRPVGQPHLRRVDEPRPHVRTGCDQHRLHVVLGVRRRAAARGGHRRRRRLRPQRARRRTGRVKGCPRCAPHRGSQAGAGLGAHRAPPATAAPR